MGGDLGQAQRWPGLIELSHLSTVGSCCTCDACVRRRWPGGGPGFERSAWSLGWRASGTAALPLLAEPLCRCVRSGAQSSSSLRVLGVPSVAVLGL